MPAATLSRWFFGTNLTEPMSRSGITDDGAKRISFTDFVEALAIRSLRADYGVPLQKIKEAIRNARDHYRIEHPFARQDHRTVLIGKDVHIFLKEDAGNPVGLTGKDLRQKSMKPCIEAYKKDLDYDADGLAVLYRAFTFGDQEIVLNPKVRFGAPSVAGSGFSAETYGGRRSLKVASRKPPSFTRFRRPPIVTGIRKSAMPHERRTQAAFRRIISNLAAGVSPIPSGRGREGHGGNSSTELARRAVGSGPLLERIDDTAAAAVLTTVRSLDSKNSRPAAFLELLNAAAGTGIIAGDSGIFGWRWNSWSG